MPGYITAETIKNLREEQRLTQRELASAIGVSDKAISKWETGRGLPDITLMEPLADALRVSVAELLTGDVRKNANRSGNLMRSKIYVCPICGNVIHTLGEGAFSCCGVTLTPQEPEAAEEDSAHSFSIERIDGEWYVSLEHPQTKDHFVSFIAYATSGSFYLQKLYPEQSVEARFPGRGSGVFYLYCNRHGLFSARTPRVQRTR